MGDAEEPGIVAPAGGGRLGEGDMGRSGPGRQKDKAGDAVDAGRRVRN
jgi:hypothetical protein